MHQVFHIQISLQTYAVPKLERGMYNQIANYVFLQQKINIKISDDAPCIYMQEVVISARRRNPFTVELLIRPF